jgi:hypothetical protein
MTLSIRDQITQAGNAAAAESIYKSALVSHKDASDRTRGQWAKAVKARREAQESKLR